jgi:transcriptional regulator with XRE-family HTH domain
MSPAQFHIPASSAVEAAIGRIWVHFGTQIRDARLARRWTVTYLARRAGVSRTSVYTTERGDPVSLEAAVRIAGALGLRLELDLAGPRSRQVPSIRQADPVHSAMGELEAGHLRRPLFGVALDEPYQHYQFAGRADVVAWDLEARALLHIENRTRFPDLQAVAGSYNAKRAYFGRVIADRLGVKGWASETHVLAALWSAEVLHALRVRPESFRAICPDGPAAFEAWWAGAPARSGKTSALIVLDPLASGRQRLFIGLDAVAAARPRYRGYADAATRLAGDRSDEIRG